MWVSNARWNSVSRVELGGVAARINKSSQVSFSLDSHIILLQEKFLQFDWLRAVVLQLNLKYLHVKITNLFRVVV